MPAVPTPEIECVFRKEYGRAVAVLQRANYRFGARTPARGNRVDAGNGFVKIVGPEVRNRLVEVFGVRTRAANGNAKGQ